MRLIVLGALLIAVAAIPARSADYTWDGATGNSDWSATIQISPGVFQNNWGQTGAAPVAPGAADNVLFPINALVTGAGNALDVTNAAVFRFGSGTFVLHGSSITNSGTLTFQGDGDNLGGPDDNYSIASSVALTGGGEVLLVERGQSRITGAGTLTNVDNTIRGTGLIDIAALINEGIVRAEAGFIDVVGTTFSNANGTVEIGTNGLLFLQGSTIAGGELNGDASGRLLCNNGGGLADLTVSGVVKQADSTTVLTGTINNLGTLSFQGDGDNLGGPDDNYSIPSAATLTGDGEVLLVERGQSRITGTGTLTNQDNTIRGRGLIDVATLVNDGVVRAEAGFIDVVGTSFANTNGTVEIGTNGLLFLQGSTIAGGELNGDASGRLLSNNGGGLADLTVSGTVKQADTTTVLTGTINNLGTLTFQGDGNNLGPPDDNYGITSAATLTGGGEVLLVERSDSRITGTGTLTNQDNTIRGKGLIDVATFVNEGTVRAEGGFIDVVGTTFTNTNGAVEIAAGGFLFLQGSTITGGELVGVNGGRLLGTNGGGLADLTVSGTVKQADTTTVLTGTITNLGTLTFQGDGNNLGPPDDNYSITSAATLTGGGEVLLVERADSRITGTGTLTNIDNTIRGEGRIDIAALINESTLRAEGGVIDVIGTTFTNTNGTVEIAADGFLFLQGSTITGGELVGVNGGRLLSINGGGLADLTVGGTVKQADTTTVLTGTINNLGTLTFQGDGNNLGPPDDNYGITSAATLTGGGEVLLVERSDSRITGTGTLTNQDNTIRGKGLIDVATLINEGTLRAEGGVIDVVGTTFTNTNGTVEIATNGQLFLQGSTITGGELVGVPSGRLLGTNGGGLANVTVSGTVKQADTTTVLTGTITNMGTLTFQGDGNNLGPPDDNYGITSAATLTGGGEVLLVERSDSRITGTGTLTNTDNTIHGTGIIDVGHLVNLGPLEGISGAQPIDIHSVMSGTGTLENVRIFSWHRPGLGVDVLPLNGSYTMVGSAAVLETEIGGLIAGSEHDQLSSTGNVILSGNLDIDVVNAGGGFYLPGVGDEFTIVTAAGGMTGTFGNSASLWAIAGGYRVDWSITYSPNDVEVEVTAVTQLPLDGDYNGDGRVDAADYVVWRQDLGGINLSADGNRDGVIDQIDFNIWRSNFGATAGSGESANVPEPSTRAILLFAMAAIPIALCRRREF